MSRRPSALALASLLMVLVARSPAAAVQPDPEEHDPREQAARSLCAGGQPNEGLELLVQMYAETNDPLYVYNQARCLQQNGRDAEAIARFRDYLHFDHDTTAADREAAGAHIAELEAKRTRSVAPPAQVAAVNLADTLEPSNTLRTVAIATGAAGGLLIGTGALFGLRVRSTSAEAERLAKQGLIDPRQREVGRRAETWQWVSYGAGVLALGGAAAAYWLSTPGAPRARVAVSGAGLQFTF
jgi:hypothetical protein